MLNTEEKRILDGFLKNYFLGELIGFIFTFIVFLMISVGLCFHTYLDFVKNPIVWNMLTLIIVVVLVLIFFVLCVWYSIYLRNIYRLFKGENYTISECISTSPTIKMYRGRGDIEILCKYKDIEGVECKRQYRTFSMSSKGSTLSDYENKDGYFVRFTDDLGFIMLK